MSDVKDPEVWITQFATHPVVREGDEWPEFIAVIKWEINHEGRRRIAGTATYRRFEDRRPMHDA